MCNHWLGDILIGTEHEKSIFIEDYRLVLRTEAKRHNAIAEKLGQPKVNAADFIHEHKNRKFRKFLYCPNCGHKLGWGQILRKI
jgi:uncharacterized protein with PIN domain